MDDLRTIIESLPPEDRKELSRFIQRQRQKKNRKDLELYQLLQLKKPLKTAELLARLYPEEPNPTAYYALRKRLLRHLTDYLLLRQTETDSTAASSVMGLLSLARYLFEAGTERLAWSYLRKAENLAAENEQFDLLNAVYNLQIEKADSDFAEPLEQIIARRNANKEAADEEERANMANSLIRQKLAAMRAQGRDPEFEKVIREVLRAYNLTESVSRRPSLLCRLLSITRSAVLARHDFHSFEPYVISQYQQLEERHGFAARHLPHKLALLYMIAHVLYRNRKFGQSVAYLEQLHAALQQAPQNLKAQYYARYVFLLSANYVFLQRAREAAAHMQQLLQSEHARQLSPRDQLTAHMGLSFCHFVHEEFGKASMALLNIPHSDQWCQKKMGLEWVLKKQVGELILQYELGNPDLALHRLRALQRNYATLLQDPAYQNVKGFLHLIDLLLNQPHQATRAGFFERVEQALAFPEPDQEDLPALSFYAWLKAKMTNRKYYEVLLGLAAVPHQAPAAQS